jgi:hypothetical protein
MLELQIVIQYSDVCVTKAHIRIGATFLTALIYLSTHWFR